ncbi:UNVERIFIED_CONTAM: hypothetical protein Sradi_2061900 [Sesamum radiatum]|uniref:Retrovirus-related Pol polyprotein from transposon TNT 1-94-like beta-barrel domain-containing protein n=1 Tax=Sesamum radiatum TaxID=300843 RepID=A0AAW2THI8_SESRA
MGKGKAKPEVLSGLRQLMSACIAKERGIGRGSAQNSSPIKVCLFEVNMITNYASWALDTECGAQTCNDLQMLQRNRKLIKDEIILKLDDGKIVAAEVVGSVELAISHHVRVVLNNFFYVPA